MSKLADTASPSTLDTDAAARAQAEEKKELRSYLIGFAASVLLTLLPFALVYEAALPKVGLYAAIGVCALLQIAVQLHFFLHIGFGQQREDLQLILFSTLLLIIMVSGTIWIMGNLAVRMETGMETGPGTGMEVGATGGR